MGTVEGLAKGSSRDRLTPASSHYSEISTKHFVAQDAKGPRSIGRFLVKLAELSPRLVLKQMSLLQAHLDCEVGCPG